MHEVLAMCGEQARPPDRLAQGPEVRVVQLNFDAVEPNCVSVLRDRGNLIEKLVRVRSGELHAQVLGDVIPQARQATAAEFRTVRVRDRARRDAPEVGRRKPDPVGVPPCLDAVLRPGRRRSAEHDRVETPEPLVKVIHQEVACFTHPQLQRRPLVLPRCHIDVHVTRFRWLRTTRLQRFS